MSHVKGAKGGTELLFDRLKNDVEIPDDINLILSNCHSDFLSKDKKNLVWQHMNYDTNQAQLLKDFWFMDKIRHIVYVSHWQSEKYSHVLGVDTEKCSVIKNAIYPIEFIEKPKGDKLKLIYTSTPWRGLEVLVDVMEMLDRDDIELDIYSSTKIYGKEFEEKYQHFYKPMFDKADSIKNVNVLGYASNEDVRKAVQEAHIFAYPSIFAETSCLAFIEAAAAGCSIVSTNYGALPETSLGFGNLVQMQVDVDVLKKNYAKALNEEIDNYWSKSNQDALKMQSDAFNYHYDWNKRKLEWVRLFEEIK
jgi:glycosyltransferase involved in cell wall biosynthesis